MNDQLALFLDGGVVIFTRSYSQANHTLNTLNSSYEPGYATLKGNTSKVFIFISVLCNQDQCFHFSGSLITGIQTGMVHWTKTRLGE